MTILFHSVAPGNAAWASLPAVIRERLAQEGIKNPTDWCVLSRARRRSLFGIVSSMRRRIDEAAGEKP